MRNFDILRYLKKWWPWIAVLSALAGIFFMRYAKNNQAYTAQSIIQYNYDQASDGLTPNGEKLDVSEIFSSSVVKEAIENLNLSVNIDSIRSGGTVTEIIPSDVQKSQEAKIDKGEDVEEYHPTEYYVKLSVNSNYNAEYARAVLDEILSCYFINFSEKYVNYSSIPNNADNVRMGNYDYIERAEILNNSVTEIIKQLGERQSAHSEFTSSTTGLSISDLFDDYAYIRDVKIPYLFSEILGVKLTQDREVLLKKYQERYASYNMDSDTNAEKVDAILDVIESYGRKNKEGSLYYSGKDSQNNQDGFVLNDVYEEYGEDGTIVDRTTVYDDLISDYVMLQNSKSKGIIDAAYCQYIINVFQQPEENVADIETVKANVENEISELCEELDQLYQPLSLTMNEYNEYIGATNLVVLASTSVNERINVKIYILLGVVVFFILGCCGAIILGRLQDFMEYFFFTDSKLNMPNRTACDLFIKNNAERILGDSYGCVVMELTNLSHVNNERGRVQGDQMMRRFSDIIKEAASTCGTVYYNGGHQFIGFFEKCTAEDVDGFADYMFRLVRDYNEENNDIKMEYTIGVAESKRNEAFSIRKLLREALDARIKQEV